MIRYRRHLFLASLTAVIVSALISGRLSAQPGTVQQNSYQAKVYFNDGVKWIYRGDTTKAVMRLKETLALDPLFVPAHEWLQDILVPLGKTDSLLAAYSALNDGKSENPVFSYLLARLHDDENIAADEYRRLKTEYPLFYWASTGLGHYYLDMGNYEEAVKEFKAAIIINPARTDAQYGLGLAYSGLNDIKRAEKQFKKSIIINRGSNPESHFFLGLASLERADTTKTLEYFNEFLSIVKRGPDCYFARAQVDSINAEFARALIRAEEAAKEKKKKGNNPPE